MNCKCCGNEFEPIRTNQLFCSYVCQQKESRKRNHRTYTCSTFGHHKPILVMQPGQADYDYWTRRDYDLYKKELLAGTKIKADGKEWTV